MSTFALKKIVSIEKGRKKTEQVEGIKVVIDTINAHIDSAEVCEHGCGALWNMTANNGKAATAQT